MDSILNDSSSNEEGKNSYLTVLDGSPEQAKPRQVTNSSMTPKKFKLKKKKKRKLEDDSRLEELFQFFGK